MNLNEPGLEHQYRLATAFRRALEDLRPTLIGCGLNLERFPNGCCGNVSPILGTFLTENGCGPFEMMEGRRGPRGRSHAWLAQSSLIIDITADQFPEIHEPVIVTTDSTWHAEFNGREGCWGDYRREKHNEFLVGVWPLVYNAVLTHIASSGDLTTANPASNRAGFPATPPRFRRA